MQQESLHAQIVNLSDRLCPLVKNEIIVIIVTAATAVVFLCLKTERRNHKNGQMMRRLIGAILGKGQNSDMCFIIIKLNNSSVIYGATYEASCSKR